MVLCEKPLAMNVAEAEEMVAAIEKPGESAEIAWSGSTIAALAISRAGQASLSTRSGSTGRFHYRGYLSARLIIDRDRRAQGKGGLLAAARRGRAGSGADGRPWPIRSTRPSGLNGPIRRVTAKTETFVKERVHAETGKVQPVGIDDACMFLAVFENGSINNV